MEIISYGIQVSEDANRTVALYRASTKQQTSIDDNDIPTQRKIVHDFIDSNSLKLIREFTEGGVSAYKNLSTEREAILSILEMAEKKEFDILIVYHSNRLGRLQDDTPLLIRKLSELGVRVISTLEGELKASTPTERLINNIRFFTNEQESALKSEVISDYQIAMVKEGKFRGGNKIPFGYKLVDNGSKNFKGRHILDFVIDREEAKIVKLIYSLSVNKNYGYSRTAKYLNENNIESRNNKNWISSTIQYILNNPIYKGQFRYNSQVRDKTILSPIQTDLIIIPEDMWEKNQLMIDKRNYNSKRNRKNYKINDKRNIYGKMLLNGLAYCGHCGSNLTTMTAYSTWTTKDGVKHKTKYYKYRCGSFYKRGAVKCNGQSTYGTSRIEPIVIEEAKNFILGLQGKELKEEFMKGLDQKVDKLIEKRKKEQKKLEEYYIQIKALKDEIANTLIGKSAFTQEELKEAINNKQKDIDIQDKLLIELEQQIYIAKYDRDSYEELNNEFIDWNKRFDNASIEDKRLMLSKIIDRITVYKDRVVINFNIKVETFKQNARCKDDQLVLTS